MDQKSSEYGHVSYSEQYTVFFSERENSLKLILNLLSENSGLKSVLSKREIVSRDTLRGTRSL